MKNDIIPPTNKEELDTSSLDEARDALLSAVESGAIREGYAEDGLSRDSSFAGKKSGEGNIGSAALSSTSAPETEEKDSLISDEEKDIQSSYRAPAVDISNIPTEKSRNQLSEDERSTSIVKIKESQIVKFAI